MDKGHHTQSGMNFVKRVKQILSVDTLLVEPSPKIRENIDEDWENLERGRLSMQSVSSFVASRNNKEKNRYVDVEAPDHSLVKLSSQEYINANIIRVGPQIGGIKFIVGQAPLYRYMDDFFDMLCENGICKIIMVTDFVENGMSKADEYMIDKDWGKYKTQIKLDNTIGHVSVKYIGLTGKRTKTHMDIIRFQYTGWKDYGVLDESQFDDLKKFIKMLSENIGVEKFFLHCSAGLGRSGCIALIYTIYKLYIENDRLYVSKLYMDQILRNCMHDVLMTMRKSRPGLIQTKAQYLFCYEFLKVMTTMP